MDRSQSLREALKTMGMVQPQQPTSQPAGDVLSFEDVMGMSSGSPASNPGVLDFESAVAMLQQPQQEEAHDHAHTGHSKAYINAGMGRLRTPQDIPIPGKITQTFDTKVNYTKSGRHGGLDIAVPSGTPIPTKVGGEVIAVEDQGGKDYGKMILVRGDDGVIRRYGHLSRFNVRPGQRVNPGEILGAVGNTGRSTGAHLHYEEIEG